MSESPISPRKLAANRENASKSTGPKSETGKARSSRNAVRHGLTAKAETLLPAEDPGAYAQKLQQWIDDLAPNDVLERALVESACRASWKLDRCARHEESVRTERARHAADDLTLAQKARAEELGRRLIFEPISRCDFLQQDPRTLSMLDKRLRDDPGTLTRELQSFVEGVDWLLARWEVLLKVLKTEAFWHYPEKYEVLRLLGHRPEDLMTDPFVIKVMLACNMLHPEAWDLYDEAYQAAMAGEPRPVYMERIDFFRKLAPATLEDAYDQLHAIALDEIIRLETLKETRLEPLAERDRESATRQALAFDAGPSAALRLRYESATERELHRAVNDLLKLRKAAPRAVREVPEAVVNEEVVETEDVPGPAPRNEPRPSRERVVRNPKMASNGVDRPEETPSGGSG